MLPPPVTRYTSKDALRRIDKNLYKARILEDIAMHDIPALTDYGSKVFEDLSNLIDLTDLNSIQAEEHPSFLPNNFQPINSVAADFFSTVKPHNGTGSLRRGFYRLYPVPELANAFGYETFRTTVLFNEGPTSNSIYKYDCNVGPLINNMAVQRNLTTRRNRQFKVEHFHYIHKIVGRTIYVSSSEMVTLQTYKETFTPKEVLWFTW